MAPRRGSLEDAALTDARLAQRRGWRRGVGRQLASTMICIARKSSAIAEQEEHSSIDTDKALRNYLSFTSQARN